MICAIIQAAESDGKLDDEKRKKILSRLAEATPDEQPFVQDKLNAPIDIDGVAHQVPRSMDIYVVHEGDRIRHAARG